MPNHLSPQHAFQQRARLCKHVRPTCSSLIRTGRKSASYARRPRRSWVTEQRQPSVRRRPWRARLQCKSSCTMRSMVGPARTTCCTEQNQPQASSLHSLLAQQACEPQDGTACVARGRAGRWHDLVIGDACVDGDVCSAEPAPAVFASDYVPLWAGLAAPGSAQAAAVVASLRRSGAPPPPCAPHMRLAMTSRFVQFRAYQRLCSSVARNSRISSSASP
jgi:hypothetical protein